MTGFHGYNRLEYEGLGIYVHPDYPDWFVPSSRADRLLRQVLAGGAAQTVLGNMEPQARRQAERFLARLPRSGRAEYRGRAHHLAIERLKECWFHVTNRCNLNCVHCMFSSGRAQNLQLSAEQLSRAIAEVRQLGCQLFYFTGGEPSIWPGFVDTCRSILQDPDAHVVILTNGVGDRQDLLTLDKDRTHFQVSVDGTEATHDAIRGQGTFRRVEETVARLRRHGFPVSLAMSVSRANVAQMADLVATAEAWDVANVHYLWFFCKGKGLDDTLVPAEDVAGHLLHAYNHAKETGVVIDNVEILKTQVFSLPGTRFDLSNAGWQSLAVGPDGAIYPSPALIGDADMRAGHLADGIETVWTDSPILREVRHASIAHDPTYSANPLKFVIGGGDIDHSVTASGSLTGGDPYVEVYNRVTLAVIAEQARRYRDEDRLSVLSRMGERLYDCGEDMGEVAFTHSNCVLSLPGRDGHSLAKNFYSAAADEPNEEIFNPVHYEESDIGHVPVESRIRSYGCGSPVLDCDLQAGETLVDLGSGTGVECFIAAAKVGPRGRVVGIDMADPMLAVAERSREQVAANLGYENVEFHKAFFEDAPVPSASVDVVISNCVLNLSPDKRKTFSEIFRMLRPGGRAVISDICYEDDVPLDVKYNQKLRGECIGGAFRQQELFDLLEDVGFEAARIVKRFLYRTVAGYRFYSITYRVARPTRRRKETVLYRGPFAGVLLEDGRILSRGVTTEIEIGEDLPTDDSIFLLDDSGNPKNVEQDICCSCAAPPVNGQTESAGRSASKHVTGCMVCGAELVYSQASRQLTCHYCRRNVSGNVVCRSGHFVCDKCHAHDALSIVREVCLNSGETDMAALMAKVRNHPAFPMHGPEHHAMVPAIILAAYRNTTGRLGRDQILTGMERGSAIAGGSCAFLGICGAAMGVGIAFSIIVRGDPYKAAERQKVQQATAEVLKAIGQHEAARCCQRDCWIALTEAARLSERYLGVRLRAEARPACLQSEKNQECLGAACPLYEDRRVDSEPHRPRSSEYQEDGHVVRSERTS